MLDKLPLNLALIKQPANWLIILLMVIIAGFAVELVHKYFTQREANNVQG